MQPEWLKYRRFTQPYDVHEALNAVSAEGLYVAAAKIDPDGVLILICRESPAE